jgi:hypothetical protein
MLKATLESTLQCASRREIWVPASLGTLVLEAALRLVGWPASSFFGLSPIGIGTIVGILCLLYWLGISVMNAALSLLRGGSASIVEHWVTPATAARAAIVTAVALVPVLIGSLLIFPGLFLGVIWSQVTTVVIDGRTRSYSDDQLTGHQRGVFEALELSALLTRGARIEVLLLFLGVGVIFGAVDVVNRVLGAVTANSMVWWAAPTLHLAIKAASDTLCLCFMAALYFELDARAFEDAERETPSAVEPEFAASSEKAVSPGAWDDWSTTR